MQRACRGRLLRKQRCARLPARLWEWVTCLAEIRRRLSLGRIEADLVCRPVKRRSFMVRSTSRFKPIRMQGNQLC